MSASGENVSLPKHVQQALTGILHGVLPDGFGGCDGLNKDDALALAGDLAVWVQGLVSAGHGWCPVHGDALCPEQYMLYQDGRIAADYFWSEDIRCGKRQPTYRAADSGRSEAKP